MKTTIILMVAILASLMIAENVMCDFGAGKSYFPYGQASISSSAIPSGKKGVVTFNINRVVAFPFTILLKRNGENFNSLSVSTSLSDEYELIPNSNTDVFTVERLNLDDLGAREEIVINMVIKDKTDDDLVSSPFNFVVSPKMYKNFINTGTYRMIVPKGKKIDGSITFPSNSKLEIKTSSNNVAARFSVGYTLNGKVSILLVAPFDQHEVFTMTYTAPTTGQYAPLIADMLDITSADTPSRDVKLEPEAPATDVTGTVIGVIIGIIACCCITCIGIAGLVIFVTKRRNYVGGPSAGVTVVSTGASGTTVVNV